MKLQLLFRSVFKNLACSFLTIYIFIPVSYSQSTDSTASIQSIDSLIKLCRNSLAKANYDESVLYIRQAEDIALAVFGNQHPRYASCLFNHGRAEYFFGKLKNAESLYLKALEIQRNSLGELYIDYAFTLNNLGGLYYQMGKFDQSEYYYGQAIEKRRIIFGENHPDYAWSLHNMGILYVDMGYYEKAEDLYLKAKSIRENNPGRVSVDYAYSLNHLAILYRKLGNLAKSEKMHQEAYEIFIQTRGPDHPDAAWCLGNQATLYDDLGNYERAKQCINEVLRIRLKSLGNQHVDYANALSQSATLYSKQDSFDKALELFQQSLAIKQKVYGPDHVSCAREMNNIGFIYDQISDEKNAELYYKNSIRISEIHKYSNPVDYCYGNRSVSSFYLNFNKLDLATTYLDTAIKWTEKTFGSYHTEYATCEEIRSDIYRQKEEFSSAAQHSRIANTIYRNQILQAFTHLSESELQFYLQKYEYKQNSDFIIAAREKSFCDEAYNNVLFIKSVLLQRTKRLLQFAQRDSVGRKLVADLKSYQRRLLQILESSDNSNDQTVKIMEELNLLEKKLADRYFIHLEKTGEIHWSDIRSKLSADQLAIEFIQYKERNETGNDTTKYAALLVSQDFQLPQFVSLCLANELDALLNITGNRKSEFVQSLYNLTDRGAREISTGKKSLYELIYKPLEAFILKYRTIYFAADGLLHQINLHAISVSESEIWADRQKLIQLQSTRQLAEISPARDSIFFAVLFGGINYNRDESNDQVVTADSTVLIAGRNIGGGSTRSSQESWNYLSGTEREVVALKKILESNGILVDVFQGNRATEETIKQLGSNSKSQDVLHLATHGYFIPYNENEFISDHSISQQNSDKGKHHRSVFSLNEHPMLRSGLILSGGNSGWNGSQSLEDKEDGVLTAYEISQMDLTNTKLVVLSACETGLGDIHGNEGVYGLQRAFKIAGAKYLIMSLWQVPDNQTSLLMTTFYKKWLTEKMSIPDAFHAAQKELRDLGFDLYQWAGFVLVE